MSLTPSNTNLEIGSSAPNFQLFEPLTGKVLSLDELKSDKATIVMFICNHCPFVIHISSGIAQFTKDYIDKGVSIIAINSNDYKKYPEDSPDKMIDEIRKNGYVFRYLLDETQEVAKKYSAVCTPDIFLFDRNMELAYHGQFDGSRPGNIIPVSGFNLRNATDIILAEKAINEDQIPSVGCNIKWKSE